MVNWNCYASIYVVVRFLNVEVGLFIGVEMFGWCGWILKHIFGVDYLHSLKEGFLSSKLACFKFVFGCGEFYDW